MTLLPRIKLYRLLLLFAILCPILFHGQDKQYFEGTRHINGLLGKAFFEYKIEDNDTILEGTFSFQQSSLSELLKGSDKTFKIKGTYFNNIPHGNWRFHFGKYHSISGSQLEENEYKVVVNGQEELITGVLKNGNLDGQWTFLHNEIVDSDSVKTNYRSQFDFDQGVPQKNFLIEKEHATMAGRFLRNGLAHDEWTVYTTNEIEPIERWVFDNGFLKTIERSAYGKTTTLKLFEKLPENTVQMLIDERFFLLLELKGLGNPPSKNMSALKLLIENNVQYRKLVKLLSELNAADLMPQLKVRVPHYPLSIEEQKTVDSLLIQSSTSHEICTSLLNDSHFNILKLSDSSLNHHYELLKEMNTNVWEPLSQLNKINENELIEVFSRTDLFSSLWPNGFPEPFRSNVNDFSTLKIIIENATKELKTLEQQVNIKLNREKRIQELTLIEQEIFTQHQQIMTLTDSVPSDISTLEIQAIESIKIIAERELARYAKMEVTDVKLATAKQLSACFAQMKELINSIQVQSARFMEIEKLYQEEVWNPFMATEMKENIKKRISSAYKKILVPHVLQTITKEFDCENTAEYNRWLQHAHDRMIQLRHEDTMKLERKLKKEQDPIAVMRLFNIISDNQ
jgi:hypothetical protein